MENKKKYRLGEVEEIVSEMEFEGRCEEIVEVDESLQLLISGWYAFIPSLSLYLRAGVACVYDEEASIKDYKPITQSGISDRMKSVEDKIAALEEYLNK